MDSSHVSDRIVAQLLAELDGIGAGRGDVYVIGATNRPDLLDSALMRPGRLDVLLYVGVDRTADSKHKVRAARAVHAAGIPNGGWCGGSAWMAVTSCGDEASRGGWLREWVGCRGLSAEGATHACSPYTLHL